MRYLTTIMTSSMTFMTLITVITLSMPVIASAGAWGDIAADTKAGASESQMFIGKAIRQKMIDVGATGTSGDNILVSEQLKLIRTGVANMRSMCTPTVQNLYNREGAIVGINQSNKALVPGLAGQIQAMIDIYVNDALIERKPVEESSLAATAAMLTQHLNGFDVKSKKMSDDYFTSRGFNMARLNQATQDAGGAMALPPLEFIWYSYEVAKAKIEAADAQGDTKINGAMRDAMGDNLSGQKRQIENSSPHQTAMRGMSMTGQIIQTYHPGSTISCLNMASGTLLQGLQETVFENSKPLIFKNVFPPFRLTWNTATAQSGRVQLIIQRDADMHAQFNASIDMYIAQNGLWTASFRTVSIGAGLSRTRSYVDTVNFTNQLTDDSETVKHLNWYYKAVYLPNQKNTDKQNVIGFFADLTNREFSRKVFETKRPKEPTAAKSEPKEKEEPTADAPTPPTPAK